MESQIMDPLSYADLKLGHLEVRLARTPADIDAVQALRYRVFYGPEWAAKPSVEMAQTQRDFDAFDTVCDHLLVIDHSRGKGPASIVGTYRLIRRSAAAKKGNFYTAGEFNIDKLVQYPGEVLELGRSCVDEPYRTRPVMQLLWQGIAAYVFHYNIDLMFGCACFPGNDPQAWALPLSYLYYHHLAPPALRPVALPEVYTDMRLLPPEAIDPKAALAALPPIIKGYLRVGAFIGDGAFIDRQFNSVDVAIVVKRDQVTEKYYRHYDRRYGPGSEGGAGK